MTDDLESRLRKIDGEGIGAGLARNWHRNPDGPEAADCIQQLEAQVARLREALEFYRDGFEPFKEHQHLPGFAWRPKERLLDDCGESARTALSTTSTKEQTDDG